MVAPSNTKKQSSGKTDPSNKSTTFTGRRDLDLAPRDYFEQVAIEDLKQNKRLSMSSENGRDFNSGRTGRKPSRLRFVVCVLGLLALAMSQMSRMVMNLTITQMVEKDKHQRSEPATVDTKISSDGSCPWPEDDEKGTIKLDEVCSAETTTQTSTESDDLLDEAKTQATVESLTTSPNEEVHFTTTATMNIEVISTTTTTTASPMPTNKTETEDAQLDQQAPEYPQFQWSIEQQSVLLGSFYYSYFVFMIAGGRLAEVYGAKYVLMSAVAGSAVINLATPWLAVTSFELLVGSRILMGVLQAGVVPGLYALIAKWLTMTEASIFAPLIKMNLRLGMLLGSSIPGLISGWPNVFYLAGSLSVVWSLLWMLLATSDPADNSWVSPAELQQIERKKQLKSNATNSIELKGRNDGVSQNGETADEAVEGTKSRTPWIEILTAPSVVALIVIKLTFNYALDFFTIELPSYLNYVHHATKQQVSSITSAMYFTQVLLIVFVGWLAKVAVQRRPFGLNKTGVRKLFQGIASFGLGITYFLLTFNDCNLLYVAVLFNVGSFLSMFASGGETVLPYDLSEKYPATIVAIANSIANVSAVTTTTTVALVLGDQKGSFARWNVLLYLVAAVNFIGGLVFTLLVRAEPIDFDRANVKNKKGSDLEASDTTNG